MTELALEEAIQILVQKPVFLRRKASMVFRQSNFSPTFVNTGVQGPGNLGLRDQRLGPNRGRYQDAHEDHGFLLDQDSYTTFDFPGIPTAINDSGQIVGYGGGHGFLLEHGARLAGPLPHV
jgi:hypothetical protein